MLEELRLVRELQKADDRLAAFARERERLAEAKRRAQHLVEEAEEAFQARKKAREEKQKICRDLERDLGDAEENIRRFKRQLHDVKTNKEYAALQAEIGLLEEKKSNLETEGLEAIERAEVEASEMREAEALLGSRRDEMSREHAEVDRKLASLDEEEAVARAERLERQAGVPEPLLDRYERLRGRNRGVAVASVNNRACGCCFRLIPPQDINLIKRGDRLMFCEGCGAFLAWPDGVGEETGETKGEGQGSG